jgi:hypothetical protein
MTKDCGPISSDRVAELNAHASPCSCGTAASLASSCGAPEAQGVRPGHRPVARHRRPGSPLPVPGAISVPRNRMSCRGAEQSLPAEHCAIDRQRRDSAPDARGSLRIVARCASPPAHLHRDRPCVVPPAGPRGTMRVYFPVFGFVSASTPRDQEGGRDRDQRGAKRLVEQSATPHASSPLNALEIKLKMVAGQFSQPEPPPICRAGWTRKTLSRSAPARSSRRAQPVSTEDNPKLENG